jgi:ABC-type dipeptide/oligopeptide/nickel transport system permease subunit
MTTRIRTALIVLGLLTLLALAAPLLTPWNHATLDWQNLAVPPQLAASHWFGTDRLGTRPVRARHAGAAHFAGTGACSPRW